MTVIYTLELSLIRECTAPSWECYPFQPSYSNCNTVPTIFGFIFIKMHADLSMHVLLFGITHTFFFFFKWSRKQRVNANLQLDSSGGAAHRTLNRRLNVSVSPRSRLLKVSASTFLRISNCVTVTPHDLHGGWGVCDNTPCLLIQIWSAPDFLLSPQSEK